MPDLTGTPDATRFVPCGGIKYDPYTFVMYRPTWAMMGGIWPSNRMFVVWVDGGEMTGLPDSDEIAPDEPVVMCVPEGPNVYELYRIARERDVYPIKTYFGMFWGLLPANIPSVEDVRKWSY